MYGYEYQAEEPASELELQLPFEREVLSCDLEEGTVCQNEACSLPSESYFLNGLCGGIGFTAYGELKEFLTAEEREFYESIAFLL